jgi:hypothetical protein
MTPEQIRKGIDDTGNHLASQGGGTDGLALDVGSSDISVGDQEELSLADEVADQILSQTPDVFRETLSELTKEHDQAMRMHNHYADIAMNGTEVSVGGNAEQDAKDYLGLAITASSHKSNLLKGMMGIIGKGSSRSKKKEGGISVEGNNTQVVALFGGHRELLNHIDKITKGADGKKSASEVFAQGEKEK